MTPPKSQRSLIFTPCSTSNRNFYIKQALIEREEVKVLLFCSDFEKSTNVQKLSLHLGNKLQLLFLYRKHKDNRVNSIQTFMNSDFNAFKNEHSFSLNTADVFDENVTFW